MKICAILQARMGSSRLPGKSLMPLAGKSMVQNVIERVRRATKLDFVVLAYPLKDNDAFKDMLLNNFRDTPGVPLGSYASQADENDLVARYLGAARAYGADIIVRVCCDNPCIEPEYIDKAVSDYMEYPFVFYSNTTDQCGERWVDGIGAEVFSVSRLKWLDKQTNGVSGLREHLHQYFLAEQDRGSVCIAGPLSFERGAIRLDVNTQADYDFIADIYNHFQSNAFHVSDVLAYLESK